MGQVEGVATGLRERVRRAYSAIAEQPAGEHPFRVGRTLAEGIGYPPDLLDSLPSESVDAFAGVSYLHAFANVTPSAVVLDLGCGAGLDSLIAARKAQAVVGVDFSDEMLARARSAATGVSNVEFRAGDAERLPLESASIDVALVNGIFNLNPARDQIFQELARVVRPGGCVCAAELIRRDGAPSPDAATPADWFA